jgi:hypothetical protein
LSQIALPAFTGWSCTSSRPVKLRVCGGGSMGAVFKLFHQRLLALELFAGRRPCGMALDIGMLSVRLSAISEMPFHPWRSVTPLRLLRQLR